MRRESLLSLVVLVTANAAAGELMILDSTHPELPVAEVIDDDKPITLPAGAQVTLVSETGEEFTLVGPFEGLPDPANAPPEMSYMVMESDHPQLPVAEVVESDRVLEIPAGATVVLVADTGQEITLEGPFQGVVGDAQPTTAVVEDELLGETTSVGATRGYRDEDGEQSAEDTPADVPVADGPPADPLD